MKKLRTKVALAITGIAALITPIILLSLSVTAPVALTGCVGPMNGTNNTAQIDATALILKNTARSGTLAAITPPTGSTNNIPYFELTSQAIGTFLTGHDYSPAAFQKALLDVKAPGADNLWVQLGIGAVIDLYQVYFSSYVQGQVNGNFAAGTFLLAIQTGFNEALGKPTPTTVSTTPELQLQLLQGFKGNILPRPLSK